MNGLPARDEFERVLHRHVLDPWFPRSLDREAGGFLCDFDYAWRPRGAHEKLLEFQARQTWVAADAARAWPEDARFRRGGFHAMGLDRLPRWRRGLGLRGAPARFTRKGEVGKDASHDGRALLYCVAATA